MTYYLEIKIACYKILRYIRIYTELYHNDKKTHRNFCNAARGNAQREIDGFIYLLCQKSLKLKAHASILKLLKEERIIARIGKTEKK